MNSTTKLLLIQLNATQGVAKLELHKDLPIGFFSNVNSQLRAHDDVEVTRALDKSTATHCLIYPSSWNVEISAFIHIAQFESNLSNRSIAMMSPSGTLRLRPLIFLKSDLLARWQQKPFAEILRNAWVGSAELAPLEGITLHRQAVDLERFESMQQAYSEYHQLSNTGVFALTDRAEALELLGRVVEANSIYRALEKDESASSEQRWYALNRLAWAAAKTDQDIDKALDLAASAYDLLPYRCEPLVIMASLLREQGQHAAALSMIQMAVDLPMPLYEQFVFPNVYKSARFLEWFECARAVGDDEAVVRAVNAYTRSSYIGEGNAHLESLLIPARDEAFSRLNRKLPTKISRRNHFLVIIPFYNTGAKLRECIDSALAQKGNYRIVLIDDASTDEETIGIADYYSHRGAITLIRNNVNQGALANQVSVLKQHADPNTIAVFLDGDDQFAHDHVLTFLDKQYHDTGCWLTYGQWRSEQTERLGYARPIMSNEDLASVYRDGSLFFPIHPRTHRVGLFHRLLDIDPELMSLRDSKGEYFAHASDLAHMRVMMQLAGLSRIHYVSEVLYVYNEGNPLSHHASQRQGLIRDAEWVGSMSSLEPVRSYLPQDSERASNENTAVGRAPTRVLLILLPGADSGFIKRLMHQGKLPNLRQLIHRSEPLQHYPADNNTTFWVSFYTGAGVGSAPFSMHDFIDPRTGEKKGIFDHQAFLTANGFWHELGFEGYRVAITDPSEVAQYTTIPNVTLVSSWLTHMPLSALITDPPELNDAIRKRTPPDLQISGNTETWEVRTEEEAMTVASTLSRRAETTVELLNDLLGQGDWDLFTCSFESAHDAMHQLWHITDESKMNRYLVDRAYIEIDAAIGQLVEDCSDVPVLLVSGLGAKQNSSMNAMADDLLDEIINNSELDVPEESYATLGSTPNTFQIFLKVEGRDPNGAMSETQADKVLQRLAAEWSALKGVESGNSVVSQVLFPKLEYAERTHSESLPDLAIVWGDYNLDEPFYSPLLGEQKYEKKRISVLEFRTGDHSQDAHLYLNKAASDYFTEGDKIEVTDVGKIIQQMVRSEPPQY